MLAKLIFFMGTVAISSATETKDGLGRPGNFEIEVYGFVKQVGPEVRIEANDKVYVVDRAQFFTTNKVKADSEVRAANYKLSAAAVKSVTKIEKEQER